MESNHRHGDFQSPALPTELSGQRGCGLGSSDLRCRKRGAIKSKWGPRVKDKKGASELLVECLAWQPVKMKKRQFLIYLVGVLGLVGCASSGDFGADLRPAQIERFQQANLLNPTELATDPYEIAEENPPQDAVCGLQFQNGSEYSLQTFESASSAEVAGFSLTHLGACGTCSSLQDLAVYLTHSDLVTPVRRCALLSFSESLTTRCLQNLGFTEPCAQTWFYNARNTAKHCRRVCLKSWFLREPNNLEDGGLNACLACDEEMSGEVFKQVAGRTRRNSGIESAIQRGDGETATLTHDY